MILPQIMKPPKLMIASACQVKFDPAAMGTFTGPTEPLYGLPPSVTKSAPLSVLK